MCFNVNGGNMNRIVKMAAASAVLLGGLVFAGTAAFGGSSPADGPVQLFGTPNSDGSAQVVLTGAVGDFGTATSVNSAGKPDPKGGYKLLTLSKGTILVNTKAGGSNNGPPTTFDAKTCSATFVNTSPATVVSGTGLYVGIDGTLKVTLSFAIVFPTLTNGKCNTSNSAVPLAQYGSVMGSGTVDF
jgi:hypothetical protein